LKCGPCYLRTCPIGHICMKKITKDEVLEKILEFVKSRPAVAEIS
jgi:hypothetical protein